MSITIVILWFLYALRFVRQENIYKTNPGLIPPRWNYDVQLSLTTWQITEYEAQLTKYDDLIHNFVPGTWTQEVDLWNWVKGTTKINQKPASDWFIEKARALENLGRYTEAIETYNDMFGYYPVNSVARINLWELYITLKKPELAVLQFIKLLEAFPGFDNYYYKQVARLYLQLWDAEQAGQRYIKYEKVGWKRNEDLMSQIKVLKDAE